MWHSSKFKNALKNVKVVVQQERKEREEEKKKDEREKYLEREREVGEKNKSIYFLSRRWNARLPLCSSGFCADYVASLENNPSTNE